MPVRSSSSAAAILFFLSAISTTAFGSQKQRGGSLEVQIAGLGQVRGFRHQLQQLQGHQQQQPNRVEEIGVFFGIPFAQPPVGALRFERPRPSSKWSGVLAADKPRSACICNTRPTAAEDGLDRGQPQQKATTYSEDCLFVNIFAPFQTNNSKNSHLPTADEKKLPSSTAFPVLVIIHGGGFEAGSSHTYHNYEDIGAKLVSQGIVVVSIQYRLGWMGFGSTGTNEMPGNLGLWDQLQALKFTHDHVSAFGGDPEQICLFGYSAGSASVSLLGASPLSRDLFARAIQMSGSPLSAWALTNERRPVNDTLALARELDCPLDGIGLKSCMAGKPIAEIWSAIDRLGQQPRWTPCVDGDFLPADVPELLENVADPKPTLMGFVELEALGWTMFTAGVNNNSSSPLSAFSIPWEQLGQFDRNHFAQSVRTLVAKAEFYGEQLADEVQTLVVAQYLKEDRLADFSELHGLQFPHYYLQRYTQLLTDITFIVPILNELEAKLARGWPIHLYLNVHCNQRQFPEHVKVHQNFHTNDENFLFRESHFPFNFVLSEEDELVEANLVQIVVNFVRLGNPSAGHHSIHWPPVTTQMPSQHMRIAASPRLERELELEMLDRFRFWRHFVQKYGHIWDPIRGAPALRRN